VTRVRVTHVSVKEIMSKLKDMTKDFKKAVESGTLESFYSPSRDMLGSGKREYLKKGENPIKPNVSGKEYEGPTKKYEKKKTKKKGRKNLRKIKSRTA
jgi:hypothetical protein